MWVLIDNYDSFTHILHHYLLETGAECRVLRNDEVSVKGLAALNPSRVIISPGPGRPIDAGITMDAIAYFHDKIPILGICLGHQAIGQFFGAEVVHAPAPVHGKVCRVRHSGAQVFKGISHHFEVMRYHSLAVQLHLNSPLQVIASTTTDETVMGIQHVNYPLAGLQFHPESVGTASGKLMIKNWADFCGSP